MCVWVEGIDRCSAISASLDIRYLTRKTFRAVRAASWRFRWNRKWVKIPLVLHERRSIVSLVRMLIFDAFHVLHHRSLHIPLSAAWHNPLAKCKLIKRSINTRPLSLNCENDCVVTQISSLDNHSRRHFASIAARESNWYWQLIYVATGIRCGKQHKRLFIFIVSLALSESSRLTRVPDRRSTFYLFMMIESFHDKEPWEIN